MSVNNRSNCSVIKRILYIYNHYKKGNNSIIPLETRLTHEFFGVNWYYEDSFYYRYISKPICSLFRGMITILVTIILEFIGLKYNYEYKFGLRWKNR